MSEFLRTGEYPADGADGFWEVFEANAPKHQGKLSDAWSKVRVSLLAEWLRESPGTRPYGWWIHDAPGHRLRLGGRGDDYAAHGWHQTHEQGVPAQWLSQWQIDYYNGRALDIHGKRIGTEFKEGDFPYTAIDPTDPPRFESVAAYLDRHGLLTAAERRRLPSDAFDPERVSTATDGDE